MQFASYVLREIARTLTSAGASLAAAGIVALWRCGVRLALAGEGLAFLSSGLVLAFVLGFDYDFLNVAVFRPYPLVAYGLLALWMGSGAAWGLENLGRRSRVSVAVLGVALATLPLMLVIRNWDVNDRARDAFADRHARLLLELLEPDAVFFAYGDSDTGPLGYLHLIEGVRPDVTLYNIQGLVFSNRVAPALSSSTVREERLGAFLASNTRPAYHMTDAALPAVWGEEHLGFVKKLLPGTEPGMPRPRYRAECDVFFRSLLAMNEPANRWVRVTRNQLLHQYGNFLGLAQESDVEPLRAQVQQLVTLARGNYYSLNGMVEMLAQYGTGREVWERAQRYLDEAEPIRDDSLDRERLSREYYLRGFLAVQLEDLPASQRWFERSVEVYPNPDNGSYLALEQLARVRAGSH